MSSQWPRNTRLSSDDYFLRPTGVAADDTAAIIELVSAIPATGGTILLGEGEHAWDGGIAAAINSGLTGVLTSKPIFLKGNRSLASTINRTNDFSFTFGNSFNHPVRTASPATFSGMAAGKVEFTSPSITLEEGDFVLIWSDDNLTGLDPHFTNQRPAELHRIVDIVSGTYVIDTPTADAFTTNPKIEKITMVPNCGVADLTLKGSSNAAGSATWNLFNFYRTYGARVERCQTTDPGGCGPVTGNYAYNTRVRDFSGLDQNRASPNQQYVCVAMTVNDFVFEDATWENNRHIFTTGGVADATNTHRWGTPLNVICRNVLNKVVPNATSGGMIGFDTHPEGYGILFDSCEFRSGSAGGVSSYAFHSRARATEFRNCRVYGESGSSVYGVLIHASDCTINNCKFNNTWFGVRTETNAERTIIRNNLFNVCHGNGVRVLNDTDGIVIRNNIFKNGGTTASGSGDLAFVKIENGESHVVRDNEMNKGSNTYSISITPTSGTVFKNNECEGYGSGDIGATGAGATALETAYNSLNFTDA